MKPDYEHIEKTLQELALEKLCIKTLETRHSDSLDFSDQAVWTLRVQRT